MKVDMLYGVYRNPELSARCLLVMQYLIFLSNAEGTCFPAIKTIANNCHISIASVKRTLRELEKIGILRREQRYLSQKNGAQTSNLYTLCVPENPFCQ